MRKRYENEMKDMDKKSMMLNGLNKMEMMYK
jgi:hypothetical protein